MTLNVKNLGFSYAGGSVLEDVSFTAQSGLCTVLLGTNGAGKTTLLKCIDGILRPCSGEITADNEDIVNINRRKRARLIGYVPQEPRFSDLSVFDSVLLGRSAHFTSGAGVRDTQITEETVTLLGLEKIVHRNVNCLSGGERQKAAVARALAGEPQILLLDEPTSNLDLKSREEITQLIHTLSRQKNIAVVVAIHDVELSLRFADRFILMRDKGIHTAGGRGIITPDSIYDVYGVRTEIVGVHGQTVVLPLKSDE